MGLSYSPGCLEKNDEIDCEYFFSVRTNSTYEYTFFAPLAVTKSGRLIAGEEDYWVSYGNASLSIEESEYGYVLNVSANGKVAVRMNGTIGHHEYLSLGTWVDNKGDVYTDYYYIYAQLPENETVMYYHTFQTHSKFYIKVESSIHDGWQMVDGFSRMVVA